jgi:CheY-like chemotaxis protein
MPTNELKKACILIAEDNEMVSQLLGIMLSQKGYDADYAINGKEVLERWESSKYDAILMDLDLPDISGLQISMTIRDREQSLGSYTPIIAVTAHTDKKLILRCITAGMNAYVTKPIDFKLLVGTLKQWIPTHTMNW